MKESTLSIKEYCNQNNIYVSSFCISQKDIWKMIRFKAIYLFILSVSLIPTLTSIDIEGYLLDSILIFLWIYYNYIFLILTEINNNDEKVLDRYMFWSKELIDEVYSKKIVDI